MLNLFELQHFSANQLHSGEYICITFKGTVRVKSGDPLLIGWPERFKIWYRYQNVFVVKTNIFICTKMTSAFLASEAIKNENNYALFILEKRRFLPHFYQIMVSRVLLWIWHAFSKWRVTCYNAYNPFILFLLCYKCSLRIQWVSSHPWARLCFYFSFCEEVGGR